MPNLTAVYSFNKPIVASPTDADLWGGYLNDNWDRADELFQSYAWGATYFGSISNTASDLLIWGQVPRNKRVYAIYPSLTAGTCTVNLKKNGTSIGGIDAVAVTTTAAETLVDDGGNAYIDFAADDELSIEITAVSGAQNLDIWMLVAENR